MIDPSAFLEAIDKSREEAPGSSSGQRLATVDPAYAAGKPRVTFDGDTAMSPDGFTFTTSYTPQPGDRVLMTPVGNTWTIAGAVGDSPAPVSHAHTHYELVDTQRYSSRYWGNTNLALPNTFDTPVPFNVDGGSGSWLTREDYSTGHLFYPQVSGIWTVTSTIRFLSGGAAGERYGSLYANNWGSHQVIAASGGYSAGGPYTINLSYTGFFAAGNSIMVQAYQTSGGSLSLEASAGWQNFNMSLIRRCS